jgi:hypothetical protein
VTQKNQAMSPSISFAATATAPKTVHSAYVRPTKKPRMSITQTYFLAHSARGKLSKEASRPDHDLRLLVGHANMLDSLMIDLANAEQEQERWFNQSVHGAVPEAEVDEIEADEQEEQSDDSAMDETESRWEVEVEEVETTDEEFDEDDSEELTLTRTSSHHQHSPPELTVDSESDSEDESMPSSPPDEIMHTLSDKQRRAIATTSYYEPKDISLSTTDAQTLEQDGFFIPSRSRPTIIAAY